MMKRLLSLTLAVALISVLVVPVLAAPVSAADNDVSTWVELLETATVNDSGNNNFKLTGSSAFLSIKTPQYMRCTKVDVLISHASGQSPKFLKVRYNGGYYTLTKMALDPYTTRFYGENIPDNLYADVVFEIAQNSTGTAYYQFLSCKVTSLNSNSFKASAYLEVNGEQYQAPCFVEQSQDFGGDYWQHYQFPVIVTDWQKYDRIVISGSVGDMALNSIRATINGLGIPYEMNYAVSNTSGTEGTALTWNEIKYYTYDESYQGRSDTDLFLHETYKGKILFSIVLDLTGVDREVKDPLYCFFVGLANPVYGYSIQIIDVIGEVDIADTTDATWWDKFTGFMKGLFDSDEGQESVDDLEQGSTSISNGAEDIGSFEQSQQDTLNSGFATISSGISFTSFSAALLFVQKYANMTFSGISRYAIIFTLPLFLGLFFYLCSRIPGITRWKPRPPQSKGGKNP